MEKLYGLYHSKYVPSVIPSIFYSIKRYVAANMEFMIKKYGRIAPIKMIEKEYLDMNNNSDPN